MAEATGRELSVFERECLSETHALRRKLGYMAEYQRVAEVDVEEVVRTTILRGDGVEDPIRRVWQWWRRDGTLIGERDPLPAREEAADGAGGGG
jgi:hypothetical protein